MRLAGYHFNLLPRFLLAICPFLPLAGEAKALYDVQPGEASGRPGSIIRIWPLEGGGPSGASGTSFRILYRSTSPSGEPVAVSGAIFIPPGSAPAVGGISSPGRTRRVGSSSLARRR